MVTGDEKKRKMKEQRVNADYLWKMVVLNLNLRQEELLRKNEGTREVTESCGLLRSHHQKHQFSTASSQHTLGRADICLVAVGLERNVPCAQYDEMQCSNMQSARYIR